MLSVLTLVGAFTLAGAPPVIESVCLQVHPVHKEWKRSPNQTQAVVLIHGYHYHFTNRNVARASFRSWQQADSPLVKELGKNADVFTFAYGQNVGIDAIVKESKLAGSVADLRKLGYTEIVLIGHSAGGIIARHFVEDYPDAGVTKVIQVCAPNGGSPLASLTAPKSQKPFLECLSTDGRKKCLEARAAKKIPDKVQFICVIARSGKTASSDGVVPYDCQWTADLQKQGIPAVSLIGGHREVLREAKHFPAVVDIMRENHDRWTPKRVEEAKKEFFGK